MADIFRLHGPAYLEKFGERMLPPPRYHIKLWKRSGASHKRAMQDIVNCRTEKLGGEVYYCDDCDDYRESYHSCSAPRSDKDMEAERGKNRSCPKCGHEQAQRWLETQKSRLLPVTYFMATVTLHDNLRKLARRHQRLIYDILFRTSAAALEKLARDPEYVGGHLGMVGVLQTWTRDLGVLHPHIHYIVPGGGLSDDGSQWLSARHNFLMPKRALSKIFRAKFRDALRKTALFDAVPPETWQEKWVVHIEAVGTGEHALKYLAPYIFQIAISNKRLVKLEDGMVTFLYKHSQTKHWKPKTVPVEEFMASFLQHVLPARFVKVRYYGLLNSQQREQLERAKELLGVNNTKSESEATAGQAVEPSDEPKPEKSKTIRCPKCGSDMRWVKELPRQRASRLLRCRAP